MSQHDLLTLLADGNIRENVHVHVNQHNQPNENPLDDVEIESPPSLVVVDVAPPGRHLGVIEAEKIDSANGEEATQNGEDEKDDEPADLQTPRHNEFVGFLHYEVKHDKGDEKKPGVCEERCDGKYDPKDVTSHSVLLSQLIPYNITHN